MRTSSIWLCMLGDKGLEDKDFEIGEVVFSNFEDGSYLYLDHTGVFLTCSPERATRFVLKRLGSSQTYVMEGRNNLAHLVRNKSKEEVKRIIDKNIERQGSRKVLETEL